MQLLYFYNFFGGSAISQFHTVSGQFLNYQIVLESEDRDRILYLAVPFETYEAFFRFEPVKTAIARFQVKLLVYNTEKEEIEQWIE